MIREHLLGRLAFIVSLCCSKAFVFEQPSDSLSHFALVHYTTLDELKVIRLICTLDVQEIRLDLRQRLVERVAPIDAQPEEDLRDPLPPFQNLFLMAY